MRTMLKYTFTSLAVCVESAGESMFCIINSLNIRWDCMGWTLLGYPCYPSGFSAASWLAVGWLRQAQGTGRNHKDSVSWSWSNGTWCHMRKWDSCIALCHCVLGGSLVSSILVVLSGLWSCKVTNMFTSLLVDPFLHLQSVCPLEHS